MEWLKVSVALLSLNFPVVSLVCLGISILIALVLAIECLTDSAVPDYPIYGVSESLFQAYLDRKKRRFNFLMGLGIWSTIFALLSVISAIFLT